ncbi:MAG: hypothetical protein GY832_40400 [Chloroflexi bacterium]|nr:hypothetical protein [Chloroflexota bacterium]
MNGFDFTGISTATADQGRALAWAVKALTVAEMSDPFERAVAELLQAAYERRLDEIVACAPSRMSEQIFESVHV